VPTTAPTKYYYHGTAPATTLPYIFVTGSIVDEVESSSITAHIGKATIYAGNNNNFASLLTLLLKYVDGTYAITQGTYTAGTAELYSNTLWSFGTSSKSISDIWLIPYTTTIPTVDPNVFVYHTSAGNNDTISHVPFTTTDTNISSQNAFMLKGKMCMFDPSFYLTTAWAKHVTAWNAVVVQGISIPANCRPVNATPVNFANASQGTFVDAILHTSNMSENTSGNVARMRLYSNGNIMVFGNNAYFEDNTGRSYVPPMSGVQWLVA
jgi:hypothetical protein